jgi:hypothetical protein
MNKIPFQNNTVIPPEWLNAIQNLSYEKEPGEAGYIPNPDDVFHFQQWKTFFTEYDEENDWCSVNYGTWEGNVILRSPYTKHIVNPTGVLRNAILIIITDFAEDQENISFVKYQSWSAEIPNGNIGVFFFDENGLLSNKFSLPGSSSFTNAEFNTLKVLSSITLPALSILSTHIANGAVTTDKIATGAVTTGKISTHAVETDRIADGAITREKIFYGEVTTDKLANYAVETDKIATGAVTSEKLANQLSFVKTPKFPRKIYRTEVVTQSITIDDIDPNYDGTRFSTDGDYTIAQMMRFTDADSRFGVGDTYRIYNDTPNIISVYDYVTAPPYEIYTKIQAWTFKDFYYNGLSWELA